MLQYHLTIPPQRASVTLTVSPTTIWERALSSPSRVNQATVTATLSGPWHFPVVVTPAASSSYALSPAAMTIAQGATTTTATLTAVNNFTCGTSACPSSKVDKSVSLAASTGDPWVSVGAAPSLTIKDDDELAKPTGLKLSVDGTKIKADWTAVTGATGYEVQWHTSDSWASPTGTQTISSGSTVTHTISGLTADTTYYVRVLPTKSGADEPPSDTASATTRASAGTGDYDKDNDGLIEVSSLAQLNAIRYDLDGDGVADDAANATSYASAFPNAEDNMGCNESAVSIASNNTGNPPCLGYELRASLDFNTNSSAKSATNPAGADSGDTYWNGGLGWDPIGGATTGTAYTGAFDGNADTDASGDGGPYTISNLFIDRTSGDYAGLFAKLNGSNVTIQDVALVNVDVTLNTTSGSGQVYVGGLAGHVFQRERLHRGQLRHRKGAGRRVGQQSGDAHRHRGGFLRGRPGGLVQRQHHLQLLPGRRDGLLDEHSDQRRDCGGRPGRPQQRKRERVLRGRGRLREHRGPEQRQSPRGRPGRPLRVQRDNHRLLRQGRRIRQLRRRRDHGRDRICPGRRPGG